MKAMATKPAMNLSSILRLRNFVDEDTRWLNDQCSQVQRLLYFEDPCISDLYFEFYQMFYHLFLTVTLQAHIVNLNIKY